MVFVDKEYIASLGIPFYDRESDLVELEKILGRGLLLVYGPRNVGKSELIKYFSWRKHIPLIVVDYRSYWDRREWLRARDLLSGFIEAIMGSITGIPFPGRIVDLVSRLLERFKARYRGLLLFLDEIHLAYSSRVEAVTSLEALAKNILFGGSNGLYVVASCSEGFIASPEILPRIIGYGVNRYLVKPLEYSVFRELAIDYLCRQGVRGVDVEALYNVLTGGCPGYLREIVCVGCGNWVKEVVETLVQQLSKLSMELNVESLELVKKVSDLLDTVVDPLEDPRKYDLALRLLDKNIVYFEKVVDRGRIKYIVHPQLPLYKHAVLSIAMDRTLDPIDVCNRVGFR